MSIIDKMFKNFAEKKLGADFEEKLMEYLNTSNCDQDEIFNEIIEHYETIIQLLSPNYQSVRLDKNDLTTIYINNKKVHLDDKSSSKGRKQQRKEWLLRL